MRFRLMTPPAPYDRLVNDGRKYPLIIFLHGSGERGDDLNLVKRFGPPKMLSQGKHFPFIVASPQCAAESSWDTAEILALIDTLSSQFAVDRNRIYLTGYSMGGHGTWAIAAAAPDRFAAIVPVAGGGSTEKATDLAEVPIWAFHGADDDVVPMRYSKEMVDAVNAAGGTAKLTVYPHAGHGVCDQTYADATLYSWLLSQERRGQK